MLGVDPSRPPRRPRSSLPGGHGTKGYATTETQPPPLISLRPPSTLFRSPKSADGWHSIQACLKNVHGVFCTPSVGDLYSTWRLNLTRQAATEWLAGFPGDTAPGPFTTISALCSDRIHGSRNMCVVAQMQNPASVAGSCGAATDLVGRASPRSDFARPTCRGVGDGGSASIRTGGGRR